MTKKQYAKCYEFLDKIDSFIGKIRQEAINQDQELIYMTDKLYEQTKIINDYIYEKLP